MNLGCVFSLFDCFAHPKPTGGPLEQGADAVTLVILHTHPGTGLSCGRASSQSFTVSGSWGFPGQQQVKQ